LPAVTRYNLPLKISASVAVSRIRPYLQHSQIALLYRLVPSITILLSHVHVSITSLGFELKIISSIKGLHPPHQGGRLTSIQCSNVQLLIISGPTGNPGHQQLTVRTTTSLALPTAVSNVNKTPAPEYLVLFSLGPRLNVSTGTLNLPFPEKPSLLTLPYPR
jgi:hypothetical protein